MDYEKLTDQELKDLAARGDRRAQAVLDRRRFPLLQILEDGALMELVAQGDRQAGTVLYQRHFAALVQELATLYRDVHFAEDVAQGALIRALTAASTWRAGGNFRAWLRRIAQRSAVDELLKKGPPPRVDFWKVREVYSRMPASWQAILRARFWSPDDRTLAGNPTLTREVKEFLNPAGPGEDWLPSAPMIDFITRCILKPPTRLDAVAHALGRPRQAIQVVCQVFRREVISRPAVGCWQPDGPADAAAPAPPDPEDCERLARVRIDAYYDLEPGEQEIVYLRFYEPSPVAAGPAGKPDDIDPELNELDGQVEAVFRGGCRTPDLSPLLALYIVCLYTSRNRDKPNTYQEIEKRTGVPLSTAYGMEAKYKRAVGGGDAGLGGGPPATG